MRINFLKQEISRIISLKKEIALELAEWNANANANGC